MKRRIKSLFLAITIIVGIFIGQIIANADSISKDYSTISSIKSQIYPIKNAKIVTFGDSITAYGGWQDEIEALGATVINSGTGGHTVSAGMEVFRTKVLEHNPDFATIMFGFNDASKGKSTGSGNEAVKVSVYKEYYEGFIKLCRVYDIIPIVITQHTCVEDIWYSESRYPDTESFYESAGGVAKWFDSYL